MKSSTFIIQQLIFQGTIMGLDMYAFTVDVEVARGGVVDVALDVDTATEIFYWRKFNALHGWMEDLYRQKGGSKASFNCTTVRLTANDLARLEIDIGNNKLIPVNGFFFGVQEIDSEDLESVATFVKVARQALADGKAVFYDSWW
jgi:hypothetical protein